MNKEHKIFFSNGVYDPASSRIKPFPQGVRLETAGGFALHVPDKAVIEDMIHLVFSSADVAAHPGPFAVKIYAGVSTRLNIVVHKQGSGAFSPKEIKAEFFLSENACVDYYQLEEPGVRGAFSTENIFHLKKHSSLDYFVFAGSDGVSSSRTTVDFQEEHGFFSAKGISVLKESSKALHDLKVNHRVPHCISRQYYKNILAGESRSEFVSLVHVAENASKSDSQQLNRNLLLSDGAAAYSKPELRIDTDDVIATHGSASGQLEDDELFYLQSRGFSRESARLVLIDGFAGEMLSEVHEKDLRIYLDDAIRRRVRAVAGSAA